MSIKCNELEVLRERTGAPRMAEIPKPVLRALNRGELETKNLVEWLAVDLHTLLKHVLPELGLAKEKRTILRAYASLADAGVAKRMRGTGVLLYAAMQGHARKKQIFERAATHRSDIVRSLAAYSVSADASLKLSERLCVARRFAADEHMNVRETAWDSFRSYLVPELPKALKLLRAWVRHRDFRVRRCAIEATRPRGVWTAHIEALKQEPEQALPLLEAVKSDSERYVQAATGNWLNDASKSKPQWVRALCRRWQKESKCAETAWIVNRALRTLCKKAK